MAQMSYDACGRIVQLRGGFDGRLFVQVCLIPYGHSGKCEPHYDSLVPYFKDGDIIAFQSPTTVSVSAF